MILGANDLNCSTQEIEKFCGPIVFDMLPLQEVHIQFDETEL
jgi:hypothetical protein